MTYNVGSRDERKGKTGYAHLFEHMMFKGSENVGAGEHPVLIRNNGGSDNASTSEDRTNYFEALPANQLELALFLESDRMRSLAFHQETLRTKCHVRNNGVSALTITLRKSGDCSRGSTPTRLHTLYRRWKISGASEQDIKTSFASLTRPQCLLVCSDFKTNDALAIKNTHRAFRPAEPASRRSASRALGQGVRR